MCGWSWNVVDVGSEFWLGRGYFFTWTWQPDFTVSRYGGPPSYSGLLPDNLMTPPRRVGRHHGAEGGGCHDNRRRPCFGEPPPHGGIGEAGINLAVEAPGDLGGRIPRRWWPVSSRWPRDSPLHTRTGRTAGTDHGRRGRPQHAARCRRRADTRRERRNAVRPIKCGHDVEPLASRHHHDITQ